jgi:hypothetical protein
MSYLTIELLPETPFVTGSRDWWNIFNSDWPAIHTRNLLNTRTLGFYHISSMHCRSTVIIAFLTAVLLKLVDLSLNIYRECFIYY